MANLPEILTHIHLAYRHNLRIIAWGAVRFGVRRHGRVTLRIISRRVRISG